MSTVTKTDWYIKGDEVVSCSCAWGCPCQFNALPTKGFCDGLLTCRVQNGHFGSVKLDGLTFAFVVSFPGALHEGNGTAQLIVDESASSEQRDALNAIASGKHGGALFEILSAICPNVLETLYAPITFDSDRDKRTSTVKIAGLAEATVEPIKNPVTGEEHRARIVLPGGFEYNEAEMGNTVHWRVTSDPKLQRSYENSYAQLAQVEWGSNR